MRCGSRSSRLQVLSACKESRLGGHQERVRDSPLSTVICTEYYLTSCVDEQGDETRTAAARHENWEEPASHNWGDHYRVGKQATMATFLLDVLV